MKSDYKAVVYSTSNLKINASAGKGNHLCYEKKKKNFVDQNKNGEIPFVIIFIFMISFSFDVSFIRSFINLLWLLFFYSISRQLQKFQLYLKLQYKTRYQK